MENIEPHINDVRFFTHLNEKNEATLAEVKVVNRWEDKDAGGMVNKIRVTDVFSGDWLKQWTVTHIDFDWQLQKTLEDARRAMIYGIFKHPGKPSEAWLWRKPPWE